MVFLFFFHFFLIFLFYLYFLIVFHFFKFFYLVFHFLFHLFYFILFFISFQLFVFVFFFSLRRIFFFFYRLDKPRTAITQNAPRTWCYPIILFANMWCQTLWLTWRLGVLKIGVTFKRKWKRKGSLTVSGQRNVKYSIKIVSILRPLDYVIASPIKNVKSRLVPTCLDDSFQKHIKRENVGQKTRLHFSPKRKAQIETRFSFS